MNQCGLELLQEDYRPMNLLRAPVLVPALLLLIMASGICILLVKHHVDTPPVAAISALPRGPAVEPLVVVRAQNNLTRSLALLLLPSRVENAGRVIGKITDAVYCGALNGTGTVLAQVSDPAATAVAPNLELGDCQRKDADIVAHHAGGQGFSGVLTFSVGWSAWALQRSVVDSGLANPSPFNTGDEGVLEHFSDTFSTSAITIGNGDVSESFALAFSFEPTQITMGLFADTQSPSTDWSLQASASNLPLDLLNNLEVAFNHTYLRSELVRYNTQLTTTFEVLGMKLTADDILESPSQTEPGVLQVAARVTPAAAPTCHVDAMSSWAGAPLIFQSVQTVPKPAQGICVTLATLARTQLTNALSGQRFVAGTSKNFSTNFGGRTATLHLNGNASQSYASYVSVFGNGGIDVQ